MANDSNPPKRKKFHFGMIWRIIKSSGLTWATIAFFCLFILCTIIVSIFDPVLKNPLDAAWCCFQAVTTIGFGDVAPTSSIGRFAIVVLSFFSLFYIAVVTGAVVGFLTETLRMQRDESVAHFITQLEHLPELSHDELVDLSEKVKRLSHKIV